MAEAERRFFFRYRTRVGSNNYYDWRGVIALHLIDKLSDRQGRTDFRV